MKLKEGRFRQNGRREFFPWRSARHWMPIIMYNLALVIDNVTTKSFQKKNPTKPQVPIECCKHEILILNEMCYDLVLRVSAFAS